METEYITKYFTHVSSNVTTRTLMIEHTKNHVSTIYTSSLILIRLNIDQFLFQI